MGREKEEIVGVNGPPGTGKTTLLRDVVADILVRRAEKLSELPTAQAGFREKRGTRPRTFYRVSPELRGFEIVVASQNNAAVENITREFPRGPMPQPANELRYGRIVRDDPEGLPFDRIPAPDIKAAYGRKDSSRTDECVSCRDSTSSSLRARRAAAAPPQLELRVRCALGKRGA